MDGICYEYPFELSDFQKHAIRGILDGNHVLITAHTGSGKTLPAEFAIQHFTNLGKRVIYTSPIKALSNQKYYEFTRKYPDITFGLMTGDIKTNPEAQVLIMTTEILMNALFTNQNRSLDAMSFTIDIGTELGCVIFDEIHYINDEDRGQVWEKTILMLPEHIQMVMLSATIDSPHKFAEWCEARYPNTGSIKKKSVVLASTDHRIVPLTHYGFLTTNDSYISAIKDKTLAKELRDATNKLILLQTADGKFADAGQIAIAKTTQFFKTKQLYHKRQLVLNNLVRYLRDQEMLPAIAFVFSRKQVEQCAKEIQIPLLEDDSKVPYTIKRECDQIVRRLPNYQEYMDLPEYCELVALLEKGIAIHHSGMIPILREIVELMISKKYIKLLFATESFAIGLDCPIKTAIFTSLTKFDGKCERTLYSHEYTQMAGRAGRRGLDTVGHVVHCNNLFAPPSMEDYKHVLCGTPQVLKSKFRISYSLILSIAKSVGPKDHSTIIPKDPPTIIPKDSPKDQSTIIPKDPPNEYSKESPKDPSTIIPKDPSTIIPKDSPKDPSKDSSKDPSNEYSKESPKDYSTIIPKDPPFNKSQVCDFIKKSMITKELNIQIRSQETIIREIREKLERKTKSIETLRTPKESIQGYLGIMDTIHTMVNKKKKEATTKLASLVDTYRYIKEDTEQFKEWQTLNQTLDIETEHLEYLGGFIETQVSKIFDVLLEKGFIKESDKSDDPFGFTWTSLGEMAASIAEVHPLIITELYEKWRGFSPRCMVGFLSVFCDIKVADDQSRSRPMSDDAALNRTILEFAAKYREYDTLELCRDIHTGIRYCDAIKYDLIDLAMEWTDITTEGEAKEFIRDRVNADGISTGDFTKAMMKIACSAKELSIVTEDVETQHSLAQIDGLILKYITTAQSLYV